MAVEKKSPGGAGSSGRGGGGLVLASDRGRTQIAPHVVAKIAGLAIREVEGVHALVAFGTGQTLSSLAASLTGGEQRQFGVNVEVGEVEAAIDCRIIVDYQVSIPRVADVIRENVAAQVLQSTGLRVTEVNVDVVDLHFAEDIAAPPPESTRVR